MRPGFTPGPWVLDPRASGWMLIANGHDITAEPFDASAEDARLIAAAPGLLEALRECVRFLHDGTPDSERSPYEASVIRMALAAIAGATGEESG